MIFLAWVVLVPVALLGGFVLLLFVVGLLEKTPVVQFDAREITVNPPDLPPYLNAMNAAAARNGFTYGGTFRHVKHPLFATFWFSPDRGTFVQVTGGTVAKMPHRSTSLISPAGDGRFIDTRDEVTVSDLSGIVDGEAVVHAGFDELWTAHLRRVSALGEVQPTLEQASPMQAMLNLDRRRAEVMVERGLAKWTDATRSAFRYTAAGAFRVSTVQFFSQLFKHRSQSSRVSRPRPGDRREPWGFPIEPLAPGVTPPPQIPTVRSDRDFLH